MNKPIPFSKVKEDLTNKMVSDLNITKKSSLICFDYIVESMYNYLLDNKNVRFGKLGRHSIVRKKRRYFDVNKREISTSNKLNFVWKPNRKTIELNLKGKDG